MELPTVVQTHPHVMDVNDGPALMARSREAQQRWCKTNVGDRLIILENFLQRLATRGADLAVTLEGHSYAAPSEVLFFEILPLAETCRLLRRQAAELLMPKVASNSDRPLWQYGLELEWHYEPWGVVYIAAADDKPLATTMTAILYALVAGNAVCLQPRPSTHKAAQLFQQLLHDSGLDMNLLWILSNAKPEDLAFDKYCLLDSPKRSPKTVMLIGRDADLQQVQLALMFSSAHYQGESRDAIWTVLIPKVRHEEFRKSVDIPASVEIVEVEDEQMAIALLNRSYAQCPVAIFASVPLAESLLESLQSPTVLINDVILPLHDPRFIYATNGLLEMTKVKTVCRRLKYPRFRYTKFLPIDQDLFVGYLLGRHGMGWQQHLRGLGKMTFAALLRLLQR